MANTDLENKIQNAIGNIIVALKAKGEKQISAEKIVNFVADKYDVVLDDDYVTDILSKSPAVAEINDDKISIGKTPEDDEKEVQGELDNATLSEPGMPVGGMGGADIGGDMSAPMSGEEMPDGEMGEDDIAPTSEDTDDMDMAMDELKTESLHLGDIIDIHNPQLTNIINEHILYSYRKNNINLKVKKINESGIYCSPVKGNSSLLIKLKNKE